MGTGGVRDRSGLQATSGLEPMSSSESYARTATILGVPLWRSASAQLGVKRKWLLGAWTFSMGCSWMPNCSVARERLPKTSGLRVFPASDCGWRTRDVVARPGCACIRRLDGTHPRRNRAAILRAFPVPSNLPIPARHNFRICSQAPGTGTPARITHRIPGRDPVALATVSHAVARMIQTSFRI